MYKISSCLFLILFNLTGCESYITFPANDHNSQEISTFHFDSLSVDEIKELLFGNWEWTHSRIMSRNLHPPNNIISPNTSGFTKQLFFDTNDTVTYYKSNIKTEVFAYDVKKFKVLPTDKGFITQLIIDKHPALLMFYSPDSMMYGNGWLDGIDNYYVRKE